MIQTLRLWLIDRRIDLRYGWRALWARRNRRRLVIAALAHLDDDEPGGDLLAKLESAVQEGNSAIAAYVEEHPGPMRGPGPGPTPRQWRASPSSSRRAR